MTEKCKECNGSGQILQDDGSDSTGTMIECDVCAPESGEENMSNEKFTELGKTYLQSNAHGRWDGSIKADTHRKLCELFISGRLGVSNDKAASLYLGSLLNFDKDSLVSHVRRSTTDLTDNLDTEIGFPLETAPNYNKLTPKFIDKFINLASEWFDDNPSLMSDELLNATLREITKNHLGMALPALESYGFKFVDGIGEEFLTMKSKLGQIVTIRPNKFFGCKFTLDKGIE